MRRLIYKDELYFFKRFRGEDAESYGYYNATKVYITRNGFWGRFFPYKNIVDYHGTGSIEDDFSDSELIRLIERYKVQQKVGEIYNDKTTLVIDCTQLVTQIYE